MIPNLQIKLNNLLNAVLPDIKVEEYSDLLYFMYPELKPPKEYVWIECSGCDGKRFVLNRLCHKCKGDGCVRVVVK